jgi:UDP-N-acetyl-D-galactosamine dehydrogenase
MKIAVIGLGYVGNPLAHALSKHFNVIGFDKDLDKLSSFKPSTHNYQDLSSCTVYIICVPTPIYKTGLPDTRHLESVKTTLEALVDPTDLVINESTVAPGMTEDIFDSLGCSLAFSPERINPGDTTHTIEKVTKLVSGDPRALEIYSKITATHYVKDIKVAELAKLTENIQRDVNIALMNNLTVIADKLNIDFTKVRKAAATKWNYLDFSPGLVGGHCIPVDPHYLLSAYPSKLIKTARETNEYMIQYIYNKTITFLTDRSIKKNDALSHYRILIIGATFKEDIDDTRNSPILRVAKKLETYCTVDIYDPKVTNYSNRPLIDYEAIIVNHAHLELHNLDISEYLKEDGLIFDLRGHVDASQIDKSHTYWRL